MLNFVCHLSRSPQTSPSTGKSSAAGRSTLPEVKALAEQWPPCRGNLGRRTTQHRARGFTWECGCAAGSSTQPEEEAFFEVVAALMQGELGVAQAVRAFAAVCQNRTDQLRCARELSNGGTCGGA